MSGFTRPQTTIDSLFTSSDLYLYCHTLSSALVFPCLNCLSVCLKFLAFLITPFIVFLESISRHTIHNLAISTLYIIRHYLHLHKLCFICLLYFCTSVEPSAFHGSSRRILKLRSAHLSVSETCPTQKYIAFLSLTGYVYLSDQSAPIWRLNACA